MVPPGAHQIKCLAQGWWRTGRLENHVKSVAGEFAHPLRQMGGGRVQHGVGVQFECGVAAALDDVAEHHRSGTERPRGEHNQQADGAAAGYQHALACEYPGPFDGVQGHCEGFHQCAHAIVHQQRQHVALVATHRDKFRERTIRWRVGAATAKHDGSAAEVAATGFAILADAAGAGGVDGDAGPDGRGFHIIGHGRNLGGELMPEDKRPGRHEAAAIAVLEVMHIRAANAGSADPQQNHARAQGGRRDPLYAQIFGSVQDAG